MSLISQQEIATFLKIDNASFIGNSIAKNLMQSLKLDRINHLYDQNKNLDGIDFIDSILKELDIHIEINENELKNIPEVGPYIVVANHPLGGIDGLILLQILLRKNKNIKLLANSLLTRIEPIKDYIIALNPFENRNLDCNNSSGLRSAIKHLKNDQPIAIFPAGEVATLRNKEISTDKIWQSTAVKLAHHTNVPVIPIYFKAKNSKLFYFLSDLHSSLRTAKLPSELLNMKNKKVNVRIGNIITTHQLQKYKNADDLNKFLWFKTHLLSKTYLRNLTSKSNKIFNKKIKPIADPIDSIDIENEINVLSNNNSCVIISGKYHVFFTKADPIPSILAEIGRLREITFRSIGEGTLEPSDLDRFDKIYHHLILWDYENKKIAGAYRVGLGADLYNNLGISGFYLSTLFRFGKDMYPILSSSIELGRAFVTLEYQQKPMPLFILWKGILTICQQNPTYQYLTGPVSISNSYCSYSRSFMHEFIKENYFDHDIARYVSAYSPYKSNITIFEKEYILTESNKCLKKMDAIISEIEHSHLKIPILLKKYFLQNAKIIGFNVDKKFNNSLDGLILLRIDDIPKKTKSYI
jgi:putative hemolysin